MSNLELDIGMTVCFWCGESKDIVIDQRLRRPDQKKLNDKMCVDYEPCPTCEANFEQGCLIMEAQDFPKAEGHPEIQEGVWPTGNHWVIKKSVAYDIFQRDVPKIFVDKDMATRLGLYNTQEEQGE